MKVKARKSTEPETTSKEYPFQTTSTLLLLSMDLEAEVEAHRMQLLNKIDSFTHNGSGFIVTEVTSLTLLITK